MYEKQSLPMSSLGGHPSDGTSRFARDTLGEGEKGFRHSARRRLADKFPEALSRVYAGIVLLHVMNSGQRGGRHGLRRFSSRRSPARRSAVHVVEVSLPGSLRPSFTASKRPSLFGAPVARVWPVLLDRAVGRSKTSCWPRAVTIGPPLRCPKLDVSSGASAIALFERIVLSPLANEATSSTNDQTNDSRVV